MNTIKDLQAIYDAGILTNDRGNGAGGPGFIAEDTAREDDETLIKFVSREQDPEAWELATESARLQNQNPPTHVAVGEELHPGEFLESNPHQIIYAV